jgi:hypothetical protein
MGIEGIKKDFIIIESLYLFLLGEGDEVNP